MMTSLRKTPLSRRARSSLVTVMRPLQGGAGYWINLEVRGQKFPRQDRYAPPPPPAGQFVRGADVPGGKLLQAGDVDDGLLANLLVSARSPRLLNTNTRIILFKMKNAAPNDSEREHPAPSSGLVILLC